jgi:alcohol dehydrogenase, propanol-preferring
LGDVLGMAAAGKIRSHVTAHPLADVNEVLEQLRHGRVSGRVALAFP